LAFDGQPTTANKNVAQVNRSADKEGSGRSPVESCHEIGPLDVLISEAA
jgi:hypothetical protein